MKRIIVALALMLGLGTVAVAQKTTPVKTEKSCDKKDKKSCDKKDGCCASKAEGKSSCKSEMKSSNFCYEEVKEEEQEK